MQLPGWGFFVASWLDGHYFSFDVSLIVHKGLLHAKAQPNMLCYVLKERFVTAPQTLNLDTPNVYWRGLMRAELVY